MTRSIPTLVHPSGAPPGRQAGQSSVWLAGIVGGALGCAVTALLLVAVGVVPGTEVVSESGRNATSGTLDVLAPAVSVDVDGRSATSEVADAAMHGAHVRLDDALRSAAAERSQLAATLVSLARNVDELGEIVSTLPELADGSGADAGAEPVGEGGLASADAASGQTSGEANGEASDPAGVESDPRRRQRGELALEGLLAAGVDPAVAADLQQRSDAWRLARLDLVDQVSREGHGTSGQLDERLDALDTERPDLRAELGDAAFDRYLYESGDANRVAIGSVIPGSTAAAAGLGEGDVVLAYAGERLYQFTDLQAATRAGSRGEPVMIEVERDGQTFGVEVPRGPLGVTLSPLRREP